MDFRSAVNIIWNSWLKQLVPGEIRLLEGFLRWLKFNAVGFVGIGVQLSCLMLFSKILGIHYLISTIIAVETAVLHNFIWHQTWTWKSVPSKGLRELVARLIRFHIGNGLVSVFGNLILMRFLVGSLELALLFANIVAIAVCSAVNFLLSECFVFRAHRRAQSCSKGRLVL